MGKLKDKLTVAKKRDYWSRAPLFATLAQYLMVFGQNCSGKSFQAKEEAVVNHALKGKRFFYLRRMVDEVNQDKATMYFSDTPVSEYTRGQWEGIEGFRGLLYFYRYDKNGKKERSSYIGAYDSLYNWQKIKSVAWVDFDFIIFEEFIAATYYLEDEQDVLQKCVSAIFRDHGGQVLMLGNSISRNVPYFKNWTPNVFKQRPGTIEVYHYHDEAGEGNEITIAIEYTGHIEGTSKMAFGKSSKTIMGGEWDIAEEPKLPKDRELYECVYEVLLKNQNFAFVMQLLIDGMDGSRLLYVYPYTGKRKIDRIITDQFSADPMTTSRFKDNRPEYYMKECLTMNKACFSDNLTANDFRGVVSQMKL